LTPLFPEIPLEQFLEELGAVPQHAIGPDNGSLPDIGSSPTADVGTKGVWPGLNASLLDALVNFRPGDVGIDKLAPGIQLTMPVDLWQWYSFYIQVDITLAGGVSTGFDLYQVPEDRRGWVDSVVVRRLSGDNLVDRIRLEAPPGYFIGGDDQVLFLLDSADPQIAWPDPGEAGRYRVPGPLLLEPGAKLISQTNGTGVAETVFRAQINMRQTKMVRALRPTGLYA